MTGHISGLDARMVLDSRGQPTVEVDCFVDGGLLGRAIVPSGASTGAYEALELRDGDAKVYLGKGVSKAVNNVKDHLEEALVGLPVDEQRVIDEVMIELDGTPNKANLGANAMLGASMACLHAGAAHHELVEVRWWCGRWPDARAHAQHPQRRRTRCLQRRRSGIHGHAPRF